VFGFLGGGKPKKPQFKLQPGQEVEIELEVNKEIMAFFVKVQEVHKNRAVLSAPTGDRKGRGDGVRVGDGQEITASVLIDDTTVLAFKSFVMSARDRDFDLKYPPKGDKDVDEFTFPTKDDEFKVPAMIPVEFRAMSTAHTQVAKTHSVSRRCLSLLTNLTIPKETQLLMQVEVPSGPEINVKGRAAVSVEDTSSGRRQYVTEIEFDNDVSEKERSQLLRYAMFLNQRQERLERRTV